VATFVRNERCQTACAVRKEYAHFAGELLTRLPRAGDPLDLLAQVVEPVQPREGEQESRAEATPHRSVELPEADAPDPTSVGEEVERRPGPVRAGDRESDAPEGVDPARAGGDVGSFGNVERKRF
jgi:hypothetical protein